MAFWLLIGAGYTALTTWSGSVMGREVRVGVLISSLTAFVDVALMALVLRRLVLRWLDRGSALRVAGEVALAFAAWHVISVTWDYFDSTLMMTLFPDVGYDPDLRRYLVGGLFTSALMFSLVTGGLAALHYRDRLVRREREAAELQTELARAQVSALRMQLNPHFLFNALNGIAGMIPERPADAQEAVAELSELLRGALKTPAEGATLADEVAWLERYLGLQALRFEDRLRVTLDVPDDLLDARVPGFLLQPVVENAFEHGVARVTRPGEVAVRARREGGRLVLDVTDNGPGFAGGDGQATGLGVATTRERLARSYGEAASLQLRDRSDGPGAHVQITLPLSQ